MWPLASLRGLGRFASPLRWPVSFCEQHWSKGTAPGVFGMKRKAQRELENRTKTSVTDYHHTVGPSLVESPSRSLRMNSYPSCWTRLTAIADGLRCLCCAGGTDGGSSFGPAGPWAPSLAPAQSGSGLLLRLLHPPSPCKAAALFGHLTASALTSGREAVFESQSPFS